MKKLWRYVHKKGIRNPMVSTQILDADGFLYFTLCYSDKGFYKTDFVKFDAAKGAGEEIFSENHVCRSCGIYEEDKFYFTSMSGKAYCLKENGELVWSTKIGEGNASFHVALDGDRFFASNRALFCLDKNNGKILWKNNDDGEKANSTFAIKGDKIYHASLGGALRCVDKTNGKCVWSHNEGLFASSCTILDERIFARTPQTNVDFRKKSVGDEKYHALSVQNNANSGINSSENLSDANLQTFKTPPQFAGGNVLLVCERDRFLFFDAQSGRLIKEYRANGVLYRAPVFASGALYIGDESGKMSRYEIDENYQMREKFSFQASGAISTNAALCDDKLYFGTEAGLVYCLDAQSGEEYFRQKSLGVARDILPGENIVILSDKGQLECYCG